MGFLSPQNISNSWRGQSIQLQLSVDDYNVNLFELAQEQPNFIPGLPAFVTVIVESGVIIGSESTALKALRTGVFAEGSLIHLTVDGRIQGMGGAGGKGSNSEQNGGSAGLPGGDALHIETPTILDYADGQIWGGGGGGGGGRHYRVYMGAGGGGGGAGSLPGAGGAHGGDINGGNNGGPGTSIAGGEGGALHTAGGKGGDPGEPGDPGSTYATGQPAYAGGAAGAAITATAALSIIGYGDLRGPAAFAAYPVSAVIGDGSPDTLTVIFSKSITSGWFITGVSITIDDVPVTGLAASPADGSSDTLVFTFNEEVEAGQEVRWSYNSDPGDWLDADGFNVPSISGALVTNNVAPPEVAPPVITVHPGSQSVVEGDDVNFVVVATGATGYQWRLDGTPISGETSSTLTLEDVALALDGAEIDCVVSNSDGSVISDAAILTVNEFVPVLPVITVQPSNQTVTEGANATFSVTATGATGYQWRLDEAPISGATSSTLILEAVTLGDDGAEIDCVVSNDDGSVVSDVVTLTVTASASPPVITSHPSNKAVTEGAPVTFYVTATGPSLSYQWRRDGAPISGATASSYSIGATSLSDNAAFFDCIVTNPDGSVTSSVAILTVHAAAGRSEGVSDAYALPTSGDLIVATNGSDGNSGTSTGSPLATIRKAAELLNGSGGTIAVRGGTYRQSASLAGLSFPAGLTIRRYGDEVPVISGAEVLTGFTPCDSGDATLLGSNWVNCFKASIPAGDLNASIPPAALNLHEAGAPLGLAGDKNSVEDDLFTEDMHNYYTADNFNDSGGAITQIQDASVFGKYTSAQLVNATAAVYVSGNWVERQAITAFNGTSTITISGTGAARYANSSMWLYALENLPANIKQGQWAYKKDLNGNGSRTVYVWPSDPDNIASGIEFSKRTAGIDISDASNVTVDGVYAYQQAGTNNLTCVGIGKLTNATTPTSNIKIKEALVRGLSCGSLGYGAFHFNSVTGLTLEHCSAENLRNCNGFMINGCENVSVVDCDLYRCSTTPIRVYASEKVLVAYTSFRYGGRAGHSNKIEMYLGNDKVLLYGVKWDDYMGYATHQQSSNIFVGMCSIQADRRPAYGVISAGNYAYKDQNYGGEPDTNGVLDLWNNFMPPNPENLNASGGTLYLGESGSSLDIYDVNNITGGGGDINPGMSKTVLRKNNLLTHAASFQNTDASDLLDTNLANTYVDAPNGDFTPKPGGNIFTKAGYDYEAGVAARAAAAFPEFDFSLDFDKSALNWSEPSVGHITRNPAAPDETAPVLSSPVDTASGATAANGSVTTNEGNGTLYWVVTTSATPPSKAQVKAGQDHTGADAADSGSQTVSGSGAQSLSPAPSGLTPATTYYLHFMHEDAAANQSNVVSGDGFTTAAVDTTAPTLSSPTAAADGTDAATGSVSTDEGNGTLYWVVTTASTSPSAAQVKAGQDHTGSAAADSGSQAVSATGVQNLSPAPGDLTAETTYFIHFMHEDAATNQSSVATSGSFETEAEASPGAIYDVRLASGVYHQFGPLPAGKNLTFAFKCRFASTAETHIMSANGLTSTRMRVASGAWPQQVYVMIVDSNDNPFALVSSTSYTANTEMAVVCSVRDGLQKVMINGVLVASGTNAIALNLKMPALLNATTDEGTGSAVVDFIGPVFFASAYIDAEENWDLFFDANGDPIFGQTVDGVTADVFINEDAAGWNALPGTTGTVTDNE